MDESSAKGYTLSLSKGQGSAFDKRPRAVVMDGIHGTWSYLLTWQVYLSLGSGQVVVQFSTLCGYGDTDVPPWWPASQNSSPSTSLGFV